MKILPATFLLVGALSGSVLGTSHGEVVVPSNNSSTVLRNLLRGAPQTETKGNDPDNDPSRMLQEAPQPVTLTLAQPIKKVPKVINNIGYVFKGYDLVMGNPLDTFGLVKVDQGFRQGIFAAPDTDGYEFTADKGFMVPKGVNVVECEGCNLAFSSTEIHSTQEYVSNLEAKARVSGSGNFGAIKGEFSASAGYKEAQERFGSNKETCTTSEVSCCVYQAELDAFDLPPYSRNFAKAVQRILTASGELGSTSTGANTAALNGWVAKFVDEFGTHYVKKVTMGSIYGEQNYVSEKEMKSMLSQGINIEMAASASGAFGSGKAEGSLDYDVTKTQTFRGAASKRNVYSRGAKPPGDGDVTKWLEQSSLNPVPTYIELQAISELPAFGGKQAARTAIRNYLAGYCEKINPGQCTPSTAGVGQSLSQVITDNQAKLHDSQTTSHQYQLQSYGVRNWQTALTISGYMNTNAWVYVGLRGVPNGKDRTYSARVADLKTGQEIVDSSKQELGWTTWDKPFMKQCPANKAVVGIASQWSSTHMDRKFQITCARFNNMVIFQGGWTENRLGFSADFAQYPWRNEYNTDLDYTCPRNHVIVGLESIHQGAPNEQRKWKILCGRIADASNKIKITPVINDLLENFIYISPHRSVVVGIRGQRDTKNHDTKFRLIEQGAQADTNHAVWSVWQNTRDDNDKEQEKFQYACPGGSILTGVKSHFKRTAGIPGVDRNFQFECRALSGLNLEHNDGRTARPGSTPAKGDWSYVYQGFGAHFALQCPKGKWLTGLAVAPAEAGVQKGRGWKIMCLKPVAI